MEWRRRLASCWCTRLHNTGADVQLVLLPVLAASSLACHGAGAGTAGAHAPLACSRRLHRRTDGKAAWLQESVHQAAPGTDDTCRPELLAPESAGRRTSLPPWLVVPRTAWMTKNNPAALKSFALRGHDVHGLDNHAALRRHDAPFDRVQSMVCTFEAPPGRALPAHVAVECGASLLRERAACRRRSCRDGWR